MIALAASAAAIAAAAAAEAADAADVAALMATSAASLRRHPANQWMPAISDEAKGYAAAFSWK